jgi:hypothetical protein
MHNSTGRRSSRRKPQKEYEEIPIGLGRSLAVGEGGASRVSAAGIAVVPRAAAAPVSMKSRRLIADRCILCRRMETKIPPASRERRRPGSSAVGKWRFMLLPEFRQTGSSDGLAVAAGRSLLTACCQEYMAPTPVSPDHSSAAAFGLQSTGANASSLSQPRMRPFRSRSASRPAPCAEWVLRMKSPTSLGPSKWSFQPPR